MEFPFFHISSFEHLSDDIKEFVVVNFLPQYPHKDIMIDIVEEAFNIELNEPLCT